MTSPIQQKVTELTFLDNSVKQCVKDIGRILTPYNSPPFIAKLTANGDWEARQQQLEGQSAKFPLISVTIGQLEDSPDFRWNKQSTYNGFYLNDPASPGVIKQLKLLYQKVTLNVQIKTENGQQMLDMVKRWKFIEPKAQFSVTGHGLKVTTKVLYDGQFVLPPQEGGGDFGNLFVVSANVALYTWIGECIEIPKPKNFELDLQSRSPNGTILEQRNIVRRTLK